MQIDQLRKKNGNEYVNFADTDKNKKYFDDDN